MNTNELHGPIRVNLADCDVEPSDEELQMLMESAIAQVRIDAEKSDIAFFGAGVCSERAGYHAPK